MTQIMQVIGAVLVVCIALVLAIAGIFNAPVPTLIVLGVAFLGWFGYHVWRGARETDE